MSLTKATYSMIEGAPFNVSDYGADPAGVNDSTAAIQAAIDAANAAGGGVVYYAPGTYLVSSTITLYSNVHHQGCGAASVLKINSASSFNIFYKTGSALDDVTIDGLSFDGSMNYPADSTVYKQTYALSNGAIVTSAIKASRIKIQNCHFYKLSWQSIDINGNASEDIQILNNTFNYGSYIAKVISVRIPSGAPVSDAQRVRRVIISGNQIDTCGPQIYYNPAYEDWISSADGIHLDSSMDCTISDNQVFFAGSEGIRVEDSLRCNVTGNNVAEPGANGIILYKYARQCNVTGNTVKSWGRTPFAYAMRSYGGLYYYAKEFPDISDAPLPADPSVSSWFSVWDYSTTNINTANVIAYSDTDYYVGQNDGILPFRGYSAIGVFTDSTNSNITGNNCIGDLSVDGSSKNLYSSAFGFSPVHPVNSPSPSGNLCIVTAHQTIDALVYRIYSPENIDPINAPSSGDLTTSPITYANCRDTGSSISTYNRLINNYNGEFTAVLTVGGGSVTPVYNKLRYTRIGRQVTVTGEFSLSGVSTPSGVVSLTNLPYPNRTSSSGTRDARTNFFVFASSLTGVTTGFVVGQLESGASSVTLSFYEAGIYGDLGAKLTNSSAFRFSFTYLTDV